MKKFAAFCLLGILTAGTALAAEKGTPEYRRLVELKKAQRAQREAEKNNPAPKEKSFWQKEAERSGLAGTGAMFTHAIGGAIPLEKPKAWKKSE
jgi:hypothetical protein